MKAVITGASYGIGAALSYDLARRGYDLVLVARTIEKLNEVKYRIQKDFKVEVELIEADLTNTKDVSKVLNDLHKIDFDIFINNAGVGYFGFLVDQNSEKISKLINLNIETLTIFTNEITKLFAQRKGGIIINLSSSAIYAKDFAHNAVYTASKNYVYSLSRIANYENKLLGNKVRVVAVMPGAIRTNWYSTSAHTGNETSSSRASFFKLMTNPNHFSKKILDKILHSKNRKFVTYGRMSYVLKLISKLPSALTRKAITSIMLKIEKNS